MEDFKKDAEDNKVMGILAYLGILVFVPILAAKDSPFARYHANQGLILFVAAIILSVALGVINTILLTISWKLSILSVLLGGAISVGFLILMIIGIMNAAKGEMKELPYIGKYTILK